MPSPLAPTIQSVTDSLKNTVASGGTASGTSITLSGAGFPGVSLLVEVTVNGVASPPSVQSVTVGATGKWSVDLTGLAAGATTVKLTEDASNAAVTAPAGSVSWSFTVASVVTEDFESDIPPLFLTDWRTVTKNNVSILYTSPNWGGIRNAREFWADTGGFPGKIEGKVFCLNYIPTIAAPASVGFSLYQPKLNKLANCTAISFWYLCQTSCTVHFYNDAKVEVGQAVLAISPKKPQQLTFPSANVSTFVIMDNTQVVAPAPAPSNPLTYSVVIDNIQFTPM